MRGGGGWSSGSSSPGAVDHLAGLLRPSSPSYRASVVLPGEPQPSTSSPPGQHAARPPREHANRCLSFPCRVKVQSKGRGGHTDCAESCSVILLPSRPQLPHMFRALACFKCGQKDEQGVMEELETPGRAIPVAHPSSWCTVPGRR